MAGYCQGAAQRENKRPIKSLRSSLPERKSTVTSTLKDALKESSSQGFQDTPGRAVTGSASSQLPPAPSGFPITRFSLRCSHAPAMPLAMPWPRRCGQQ